MFKVERQEGILRILHEKQHCTVEYLAAALFASPATIRRDILAMEQNGLVRKSYGGVSLLDATHTQAPAFEVRQMNNANVKDALARRAATLVHDGDTILLDSSSTVLQMIPHLAALKNITVITNSLRATAALQKLHVRVYCTGGVCNEDDTTLSGSVAESALRSFHTDLLFFSSRGVSPKGIISDSSDINTQTRRVMLRQTSRSVFLCDSSKLNHNYLFNLCHISEVDTVLCDQPLPESWYY